MFKDTVTAVKNTLIATRRVSVINRKFKIALMP